MMLTFGNRNINLVSRLHGKSCVEMFPLELSLEKGMFSLPLWKLS